MFTLEIGGHPVAVTDADEAEARELFESEEFKDDLKTLEGDDGPLWDGTAPLTVRAASQEEISEFEEAEGEEDGEPDEEEGPLIVFLVPIGSDGDDDEDEDGKDDGASAR